MNSTLDTVTLTLDTTLSLDDAMEDAQRQYISAVLRKCQNDHSAAARQLGIGRTTLWRRLEEKPRNE